MNTISKAVLVIALAFLFPLSSTHAVIQNLNSQTGSTQTFANDLNIGINSSGNTHTLNWSGILPVSRGGTGESSYATGTIPFFWNGKFSNTTEGNSRVSFTSNQGIIVNQGDISMQQGARVIWFEEEPDVLENGQSDATQYASITSNSPSTIDILNTSVSVYSTLNFLLQTANRTFTFQDSSGTLSLLEANQKWTGANTFSKGASATTTVNFGEVGDSTSQVCFNTKNTSGNDISFYFVGTSMVVENNNCN